MKSIRINLKILVICFLIIITSYFSNLRLNAEDKVQHWEYHARNYGKIDKYLNEQGKGFYKFTDYFYLKSEEFEKEIEDIKTQIKNNELPNVKEIESLFNSKNEKDMKIACLIVSVTDKHSDSILQNVLNNIESSMPYGLRDLCIDALDNISRVNKEKLISYGESILQLVKSENDDDLLLRKLIILNRLNHYSRNSEPILIDFILNNQHDIIKAASYILLKKNNQVAADLAIKKLRDSYEYKTLLDQEELVYQVDEYLNLLEQLSNKDHPYTKDCKNIVNQWFDKVALQ